ncbi:MAG: 3-deoxy-8-phosphooctulonate synthase [Sumerlaeia bacterium]
MPDSSLPLDRSHQFHIGPVPVGGGAPMVLIAGPCVIESPEHTEFMAREIKAITDRLGVPLVFKASFDKANRSSGASFRGPGLEEGLRVLGAIKAGLGVPVLTDVHTEEQAPVIAQVCDILQIPAFLCRQTDFVEAVGRAGKPVNVKKGQFMAPRDIKNVADKLKAVGCEDVLLTERGVTFGYGNLVVDFRSLPTMRAATGLPVCFDATHSVQQPGGLGHATGGDREFVPVLARAACAVGIDALFMEVHDNPDAAKSDGPNMVPLSELELTLRRCLAVGRALA